MIFAFRSIIADIFLWDMESKKGAQQQAIIADGLQEEMGPGRVMVTHARHLCARRAQTVERAPKSGVLLRCPVCGHDMDESMKLAVRQDHYLDSVGAKRDWVRVPTEFRPERRHAFSYVPNMAVCSPSCSLGHLVFNTRFPGPARGPDLVALMMFYRHGVTEPVICAPGPEVCAYMYDTAHASSGRRRSPEGTVVGMGSASFYELLASQKLSAKLINGYEYAPVTWQESALAHTRSSKSDWSRDLLGGTAKYWYCDGLPEHLRKDVESVADDGELVKQDGNPDSDAESDFATGEVHPPLPSFFSTPPPAVSAAAAAVPAAAPATTEAAAEKAETSDGSFLRATIGDSEFDRRMRPPVVPIFEKTKVAEAPQKRQKGASPEQKTRSA